MALPYEPLAIALNIIFVIIIAFSSFRLMWIWRHRKFLAIDFFGMGSSYLVLLVWSLLWFLTLKQIFFFLMAIWSIFWALSYSYAMLRITHPTERRPMNWSILLYLSAVVIWVLTRDLYLTSLQILLITSLTVFVSSLFLITQCSKPMRKYGIAGMISGLIGASYVPVAILDILPITLQVGFFVFVPINLLVAYMLFGFLQVSNKNPKGFICDYDHRKDRKK